jgi:hypothetical protein
MDSHDDTPKSPGISKKRMESLRTCEGPHIEPALSVIRGKFTETLINFDGNNVTLFRQTPSRNQCIDFSRERPMMASK